MLFEQFYTLKYLAKITNGSFLNIDPEGKNYKLKIRGFTDRINQDDASVSRLNGIIFIAIKGQKVDGHDFIGLAQQLGALAVIVENPTAVPAGFPAIVVPSSRNTLSFLSALCMNYPANHLQTIGVTGTNGKSTIVGSISQLLGLLGQRCLRMGTMGISYNDQKGFRGTYNQYASSMTTPDVLTIHQAMRQAVDNKIKYCAMEVSSHALDQSRVDDIKFTLAIFTNLTRDHLDYHKDMEAYFLAKQKLFNLLKLSGYALVCIDDQYGQQIINWCRENNINCRSYGFNLEADIIVSVEEQTIDGMKLSYHFKASGQTIPCTTSFIGKHNAVNLAAVFACGVLLGYQPELVGQKLAQLRPVRGRLDRIEQFLPATFIDYAHTPDAIEHVLSALRPLCLGKLWIIFGCGGDRDRGKRPQMGTVAAKYADYVVLTSDNPRSEEPNQIIEQIMQADIPNVYIEPDRAKAIAYTLENAAKDDVVLIAGKGHEEYRIIGSEYKPFSDYEQVRIYQNVHCTE